MNIEEVMRHLPHRYPFLLIDRVLSCEPYKHIVALKNVTMSEEFFIGHFPNHPVMPGVLVIEALAQSAAILAFKSLNRRPDNKSVVYFVGIDRARFKRPVVPGDQLMLYSELLLTKRGIWKFKCEAKVNDATVAEATLMSTEKIL
ncbi:MAG: 3-hydroxyacyl-ACP dehydratase FabZ [Pseudomonadota bacterium]|nr:3-hydroxyacyl-ACP dehydratase FabZ [Pseudomonadota bacterium]